MRAMILAAGEGQRFRPFTEIQPKPAIPFCGYPLLYFSLFQIHKLLITKLVINTYHLPEKIEKLVSDLPSIFSYQVAISNEKKLGKLLGSGGGIAYAKRHLEGDGSFLVLNADEVIVPKNPNIMVDFLEYFERTKSFASLLTMEHPEAGKKFGAVWVDAKNRVVGFGRIPPKSDPVLRPLHFLGTQILKDSIFTYLSADQESNILYDTISLAIQNGEHVTVFPIDCFWHETGNPQDFLIATEHILKLNQDGNPYLKEFYKKLGDEFYFVDNQSFPFFVHRSVQGYDNVQLDGFCVAGAAVHFTEKVRIKNTVIGSAKKIGLSVNLNSTLIL
jgi:mannose-1-phosphate guanylyltransferase